MTTFLHLPSSRPNHVIRHFFCLQLFCSPDEETLQHVANWFQWFGMWSKARLLSLVWDVTFPASPVRPPFKYSKTDQQRKNNIVVYGKPLTWLALMTGLSDSMKVFYILLTLSVNVLQGRPEALYLCLEYKVLALTMFFFPSELNQVFKKQIFPFLSSKKLSLISYKGTISSYSFLSPRAPAIINTPSNLAILEPSPVQPFSPPPARSWHIMAS